MKLITLTFASLLMLTACYKVEHFAQIDIKGSTPEGFKPDEKSGELCADVFYKVLDNKGVPREPLEKDHFCTDKLTFNDGAFTANFPFKLSKRATAYDITLIDNVTLQTQYDMNKCFECAVNVTNNNYSAVVKSPEYSPSHIYLDLEFTLKDSIASQRWNASYPNIADGCRKLEFNSAVESCLEMKVLPDSAKACAQFKSEVAQLACVKNATTPFPQNIEIQEALKADPQ